jgi:hypothetical protein
MSFPRLARAQTLMRLTVLPGVQEERQTALTGNMSKADSQYVDDALTIEDEYESELAAVQVALTRFEVAPHEYAARRAEIAARAYLKLAEAHKRFLGRNN